MDSQPIPPDFTATSPTASASLEILRPKPLIPEADRDETEYLAWRQELL